MKNTPTPYHIGANVRLYAKVADGYQTIVELPDCRTGSQAQADLEFLQKAANNHDSLVAALENLLREHRHICALFDDEMMTSHGIEGSKKSDDNEITYYADAILAKVKSE